MSTKIYTVFLDDEQLAALSFLVDAALKGAGMAAHRPASLVLQAVELGVQEAQAQMRPPAGNGHAPAMAAH